MSSFNGDKARALREQRGLSREQLGIRIGRGFTTVVKVERGEIRPSITTLGRMAGALGVSVADFFDDDEPDLLGEHDPRPSDLGPDVDDWLRAALASMPPLSDEQARRVSALLFPAVAAQAGRMRSERAS